MVIATFRLSIYFLYKIMPSEQSSKRAWELWIVVIKGLLQSAAPSGKWSLVNLKPAVENRFGFTQLVNVCLTAWFCRRKGRDLFQHCTTSLLLVEKRLQLTGVVRGSSRLSGDVAWLPCSATEPLWRLTQIAKGARWLTVLSGFARDVPKKETWLEAPPFFFQLDHLFFPHLN